MTSPLESPARPHWSLIELGGRRCELFDPPSASPGRALLYLHDVAERRLQDIPGLRDAIEAAGLPAVAPHTGRSWWLDRIMPAFDSRITPERFVVEEVRGEIARRFGVQPPGIALIGVGMGGQGALRIAYRHPTLFPVAAAIAPAIDFHMAMRECDLREDGEHYDTLWETFGDVERARQDTAILHVHPLNWPRHQWFSSDPADVHWHDGAARLQSKLRALGIPHTAVLEPHAGQAADISDRMADDSLRFILEALDQESRRLA
ncbi:MAG: alpha/beta hydrolase-fold protein [Planctomycetia bacterium]